MHRSNPPYSRFKLAGAALLVALPGLGACDIPTETPRWNTDWTLLGIQDSIVTGELLPEAVREVGTAFVLDSIASSRKITLGQVCEVCTCFEGPIPRIEIAPQDWTVPLPSGVSEATLTRGTARVKLVNQLGFDLLDNGEGDRGWLLAQLVDRRTNTVMDSVRIEDPFPPGDSLTLSFDLQGLQLHRSMVARVQGVTPGTGCESIDLTEDLGIRADVVVRDMEATGVKITLYDHAVAVPDQTIDIPQLLRDRLRAGEAEVSLEADVVTTVGATFDLSLSLASDPSKLFTPEATLWTPIPVPPGTLEEPSRVRKLYLLDVAALQEAETLFLSGRNRVEGNRTVEIRGGEGVVYRVFIHATVPTT